ncbi:SusD/RagB family nutrient-binding outer membrane lipoprotein [Phocaeicola oris]|uniref:SusD/RagB family nutrient-binding outer membrane lipoprotein n=1 Tax=Phocaeicola oris TaxID=2896850 RepID=UPI00234EBCFF|nr:SusD/RagB family nutrient-binding outer membrane lipoprotein [Phocaeicola oris]MCE2617367.1 SusD/RagB family nutrient-binding outer membrane lipoprotein [Phocaeicola oris]
MKKIYCLLLICFSSFLLIGCDDFEEVNTNPNTTPEVTSAMLATKLINELVTTDNENGKGFIFEDLLSKYISWTEAQDIDKAFNLLSRPSYSTLANLRNAVKMIDMATTDQLKNSYTALSHFIRAYVFFNLTIKVGDMPYSEAIEGEEGNYFPKYDTQKDIFLGLLNELDEADRLFAQGVTFAGDYIYNGDVSKWRKAVNVLQLKLLINLYRKTDDLDLKVKERFNTIINERPIFESIDDNFQVVYSNKSGQKYPYYKEINSFTNYDRVTSIVVDKLKELGDYRLFYYAKPTPNAIANKVDVSSWDAYGGVDPMLPESDILKYVSKGNVSPLNDRYKEIPEGEPVFFLSYQEMNYILAEAAARGFIPKSAKDYYEEGIRSSMQFVSENTPDDAVYHHNRKMTKEYVAEYLKGEKVSFADNLDDQIRQIIWQKYLLTFLQTPYNGFYEYRRTGVPEFVINPQSNRNIPSDKMPLRWMYPIDELNYNMENVTKAIKEQYNGSDDYMGVMWILK